MSNVTCDRCDRHWQSCLCPPPADPMAPWAEMIGFVMFLLLVFAALAR